MSPVLCPPGTPFTPAPHPRTHYPSPGWFLLGAAAPWKDRTPLAVITGSILSLYCADLEDEFFVRLNRREPVWDSRLEVISIIDEKLRSLAWFLLIPAQVIDDALVGPAGDGHALSQGHLEEGRRLGQPHVPVGSSVETKHKVTIVYQVPLHIPPRRFWRPWSQNPRAPGFPRGGETLGQGSTGRIPGEISQSGGEDSHRLRDVPCTPLPTWEAGQQKAEELGWDSHVQSEAQPEAFLPRMSEQPLYEDAEDQKWALGKIFLVEVNIL
ncbi:uncharacterized protein LOC131807767 [Mustela lutreola]|uniref:uncharacterized protein LOC131807767 n=1 Tax=Mustela lutreola TaxID=9666 RepID=UPI002796F50C|nr:uncharacterized protein LOC131807767 [Mustela lutreola]